MYLKTRADDANTAVLPAPYIFPPSGIWDGNDGKWSSFFINVAADGGNGDGQNFRVLISTSSSLTLVPGQTNGCGPDCAATRGVELFNSRQPTGFQTEGNNNWNEVGIYKIPYPFNQYSYPTPNATFGLGTVGLQQTSKQSPVLPKQWVVEYETEDFFMGSFGLGVAATNPGGGSTQAFLYNFNSSNPKQAPSLSYGYTAGASYQNGGKGVLGNLVLGGYDESRFGSSKASINMPENNSTLIVGVQSMIYRPNENVENNEFSLTAQSSEFFATIDSTLPYLWLPDGICDQIARLYQLTWDNSSATYLVNASAHNYNKQQNATLDIRVGENTNNAVTITLPYDAFDLQASSPMFPNATNYFPLKKSPNGEFVLGRAFLQEAYIVVDYERKNFTVAQVVTSDPLPSPKIATIFAQNYVPPSSGGGGGGLSGGAIAGIVVGIVVVLGAIALGAFFWWKKKRQPKNSQVHEKDGADFDTTAAGEQVKHRRVSELASEPPNSPKGGYYGGRDQKDGAFPPISEMESPPAELYSPPAESVTQFSQTPRSEGGGSDYFIAGTKVMRRRGATRESSGHGTPILAELPGDDGNFTVNGQHFEPAVATPSQSPLHSRGPSDSSLATTNIDQVISGAGPAQEGQTHAQSQAQEGAPLERRPSHHARGPSDTTVNSDTTAVSNPTPEELENWALAGDHPRDPRPLSE